MSATESLGNRTTQDYFGLRLIEDLNTKVGPSLPDGVGLLEWIAKIAITPEKGFEQEQEIGAQK